MIKNMQHGDQCIQTISKVEKQRKKACVGSNAGLLGSSIANVWI